MAKDTVTKVSNKLDELGQASEDFIRLSTGVELNVKQANPNILIMVMAAEKRPEPPVVFMKDIGKEMENPDDPDYISRVQAYTVSYSKSMLSALIGLGTSLRSKPKGVAGPDDDTWLKDYKTYGLQAVPDSKAWRYITWVMFVAAPTAEDTKLIGDAVKRLSGVREADVRDAETFPGRDEKSQ